MAGSHLPILRLRIPCNGEAEFREKFAGRYAAAGIFVPSEKPRAPGTHVRLVLEFRDGSGAHVSGEAVVTSHQTVNGRAGMKFRFLGLDPDSIRFELAPADPTDPQIEKPFLEPAPEPAPPAQPSRPADLASELFAGSDLPDTASSRPIEVRSRSVTLRVKESEKPPLDLELPELDPKDLESIEPAAEAAPAPAAPPAKKVDYEEYVRLDDFADALDVGARATTRPDPKPAWQPPPASPASGQPARTAPQPTPAATRRPAPRRAARKHPRRWLRVVLLLVAAGVAVELYLAWPSLMNLLAVLSPANPADPEIVLADTRAAEGRLIGDDGDAALDHLMRARQLAPPGDPRIRTRLRLLADKLEELATLAQSRGNLAEAAAHLKAALRADPSRSALEGRLSQLSAASAAPAAPPTPPSRSP